MPEPVIATRRCAATLAAAVLAVLVVGQSGAFADAWGPSGIDYGDWTVRTIRPLPDAARTQGRGFTRDGRSVRFLARNRIYVTSASDGSGTRCVNCKLRRSFFMGSQNGSPFAESPDGRWLLVWAFEATETGDSGRALTLGQISDSNLFALSLDARGVATAAHQLTFGGIDEGNIRPIFTPDGERVIWWKSEGIEGQPPSRWKRWLIAVADFAIGRDGRPRLRRERPLVDGGKALVEDGGLTGDGRRYYYLRLVASDPELFALDIPSGRSRRLTDRVGWDEFPSPALNGEAVTFISDRARSNPICDPIWSVLKTGEVETEVDYLLSIPGSVICGLGEAVTTRPDQRPNYDNYLMDADGRRVTQITFDGRYGTGSWRPDSREVMFQQPTLEAADDEIAFLTFAREPAAAGSRPRLSLRLRFRSFRPPSRRRCSRGRLRATVTGRDLLRVGRVDFYLGRRFVGGGSARPFTVKLRRSWIARRRAKRLRARVVMKDGRRLTLSRRLGTCASR